MLNIRNKIIFALVLGFIGLLIIIIEFSIDIVYDLKEDVKVNSFLENSYNNVLLRNEKTNNRTSKDYIGVLEIPSIKVKKGIYSLDSKFNSVANGIELLSPVVFPNKDKSIVILASHSGNSKVSYFKRLIELKESDIINFYYMNYKYKYEVVKCLKRDKNGYIAINDFKYDKVIVLTTCKDDELDKQFTCYGKLVS